MRRTLTIIFILFLSYLLFLGSYPLFDWDEINFAEAAREMLVSGNWLQVQINFQPFWEKPPLFFWLQAASMKIFGINEFAARFPNALFGLLTLLLLFQTGKILRGLQYGFLLVAFYGASFLPYIYFKSGIIDPVFNFFAFLAAAAIFLYEQAYYLKIPSKQRDLILQFTPFIVGIGLGFSSLAKGTVNTGLLLVSYLIYVALYKKFKLPWKAVSKAIISYLVTISLWLVPEILTNGTWFIEKFLVYQIELFTQPVAGHGQPFYYHFIVLLLGCFPMVAFFIQGLFHRTTSPAQKHLKGFMFIWFAVILTVFSISTTKIVHYSSMTYIPMVFIAAWFFDTMFSENISLKWFSYLLLLLDMLLFGTAFAALPYLGLHPELLTPYIKDPVAVASLNVQVDWNIFWTAFGMAWLLISLWLFRKLITKDYGIYIFGTLFLNVAILNVVAALFVPRIAEYSQGPAVKFFKSLQNKNAYVITYGYKSYAHYFYRNLQPDDVPPTNNPRTLAEKYTKPVFVSMKINKEEEFRKKYPMYRKIKREGAFVFYKYER